MAQIAVNVGMNLRVLPVIGVTLPFYSAGGSSDVYKRQLKNSTEYPSCNPALLPSSGVSMAKEVLAVRGIARHGPMDR